MAFEATGQSAQLRLGVSGDSILFPAVTQLVSTKFRLPRQPRDVIPRPRLMQLLRTARDRRLTLIESPSGFGKTGVAAAWARQCAQDGCRVAWLSLDKGDDEVVRFLHYLVTAIEPSSAVLPVLDSKADTSWLSMPTVVSNLINAMSREVQPLIVFLDDYHYLRHPQIHEAVTYLLVHAPECFHLVLTSSSAPPFLPLAKLRAQGELFELDALDLSFDLSEIEQFLALSSGNNASPDLAQLLLHKTGGWIAALSLAARGLSNAADPARYVAQLSGASRQIGDYLSLIWEGLPADVRNFMLRTSILERLTAPLCEAVTGTGKGQGQQMLDAIERHHLLLVPLDHDGIWFRNHNLIAEYLRRRLAESGEPVAQLHQRAAAWCAANDMWTSAIEHAIAGGDREQAAAWIERCTFELVRRGELMTVIGWYGQFPQEMTHFQNHVRLAIAWAHVLASRESEVREMLNMIEHDLGLKPPEAEPAVRWEWRLLQGALSLLVDDDSAKVLSLGLDCLREPPSDPWLCDAAGNAIRFGYLKAGDFQGFLSVPWFTVGDPKDVRTAYPTIYRRIYEGMMALQQARFAEAERSYRDAYRIAKQHFGEGSIEIALSAAMVAEALYEQNHLEAAAAMLRPHMEKIASTAHLDPMLAAYRVLVRLNMLDGALEQADFFLQQGIALSRSRRWGRLSAVLLLEQVRRYVLERRMAEAEACVAQISAIALVHPVVRTCAWSEIHVSQARAEACVAVASADYGRAIAALSAVFAEAGARQNHRLKIRAGTELAAALLLAGHGIKASQVFDEVLISAVAAGAARAIADCGQAIWPLLEAAGRHGVQSDQRTMFLQRVAEALGSTTDGLATPAPPDGDFRLSAREARIVELVADGHSNKQVAKMLDISPETVKSHLKNCFTKLNVTTRAQAVGKLREKGHLHNLR